MSSSAPKPAPGTPRDTESARVPLCDIPLHDAEGTDIPFWRRIEQVAVDQAHGAHPARLHQQGEVIGRSAHPVYVRFECDHQMIALRPHLVRLIEARCS
jgi:hypothetical protein